MTRRLEGGPLLVATHNAGKLQEFSELLEPFGVKVVGAADLDLDVPEETEATFVGNARIKAHAASRAARLPALADDSGIEIDPLGGEPGVHTADWAETPDGRDFNLAMTRAHEALKASGAAEPWAARFCCTLVVAWPDGYEEVFEGTVEGHFVWPMRGRLGHGYDPVFQALGYSKTFAELEPEEKNRVSHRAKALEKFVRACLG